MTELAASAGASAGRARGRGTGPVAAAATAKMPGRCRGKGTGPRMGSLAGRTSAAAVRAGGAGGAGGASRGAAKSGGLVVFGLGQAILRSRSEELGAPIEGPLSPDRGAGDSLGAGAMGGALGVVDMSPVVLAVAVIADEDVCIACKEVPDGPFAAVGGALAFGSEARFGRPPVVSAAGLVSLTEASSMRCGAD